MTLSATAARSLQRVLLVASDLDLALHVQRLLSEMGCTVIETVGDGSEAVNRCARFDPQLVLIEQQLCSAEPVWTSAQRLRDRVRGPIIFLCDPGAALPEAAFTCGLGFVDKPVARRALTRAINLASHRYSVEFGARAPRPQHDPTCASSSISAREPDSNRLSPELLCSMAHELRAPLQGVLGFATFLRDGKAGTVSETQHQYLDHIVTGANHVLQVINDVLDMTATVSDALHVRTQPVDPEQAAREVMQVLQVIAFRRRIAVEIHHDEQLGHIVSDATKIKQVLYNLVSNALKFTPAGGSVAVSVRRDGPDAFCIEVADTGTGIPPERMARLFERPADVPGGATGSNPGPLGLFLTKRIVDALGGTVSASNLSGGGCRFVVRLPLAPSVAEAQTRDILPSDDP